MPSQNDDSDTPSDNKNLIFNGQFVVPMAIFQNGVILSDIFLSVKVCIHL